MCLAPPGLAGHQDVRTAMPRISLTVITSGRCIAADSGHAGMTLSDTMQASSCPCWPPAPCVPVSPLCALLHIAPSNPAPSIPHMFLLQQQAASRPHRFYVQQPLTHSVRGALVLDGDEGRHAVRALRLKEGDTVELCDGRGALVQATITALDKSANRAWVGVVLRYLQQAEARY